MRLLPERLRGRPLRYLIVGGWNTGFGVAFFTLLYLVFGKEVGYALLLAIAQIVAILQSHFSQRLLVWRSKAPYMNELMRFSMIYGLTYVVNLAALAFCLHTFHSPVLATQWCITAVLLFPVYLLQRAWAFAPALGEDGRARSARA